MKVDDEYNIPGDMVETTIVVKKSRFIGKAVFTPTLDDAKEYIRKTKKEFSDSSHVVYAYCIGFGKSVIYGMSDAGEPPGTAGRPVLEVVKGSGIGDITLVVIRYFGGTKLGTGGLVKAYTESAQTTLGILPVIKKIKKLNLVIELGYECYNAFEMVVAESHGEIIKKEFTTGVYCEVMVPEKQYDILIQRINDISAGKIKITKKNQED